MRKLIVSLLALALPLAALPNGYDVPNVSARDLAMTGSAVAAQVDAGAVYASPASLARIQGLSLALGGSFVDNQTSWTGTTAPYTGQYAPVQFKPVPPPSLFASYGTKIGERGIGFGIGMNLPAGGNVYWNDDWQGRASIITVDRKVYAVYATAGVEIIPQVRVGGGAVYYRTTEYLKQGLNPDPTAFAELSTAGGQISWDAAVEITPLLDVPLTLVLDYKHQAVQKLTGTAHFTVPATLQPLLQDQNVTHVLTYPSVVNAAASYRIVPEVLVAFTYTWNRYQVYQDDTFVGDKPLPGPIIVPRNYGNGYTFRLGGEWMAMPRLAVRAGVEYDRSGMPQQSNPSGGISSNTYSASLPDSNTWAFGLGGGWNFTKNFQLNVAGFYALQDEVTATPPPASFPGLFKPWALILAASLVYSWDIGQQAFQSY